MERVNIRPSSILLLPDEIDCESPEWHTRAKPGICSCGCQCPTCPPPVK